MFNSFTFKEHQTKSFTQNIDKKKAPNYELTKLTKQEDKLGIIDDGEIGERNLDHLLMEEGVVVTFNEDEVGVSLIGTVDGAINMMMIVVEDEERTQREWGYSSV